MKQPSKPELLKIESAKDLIAIRDSLKNPKNTEKEKHIMFAASNEISKLYGKKHPRQKDNCPGCINMIKKQLNNWFTWYDESMEPKTKEPDELPKETIAVVNEEGNLEPKEVYLNPEWKNKAKEIVDLSKLSWQELKSYAASKGINTKGKKKAELIEEINKL